MWGRHQCVRSARQVLLCTVQKPVSGSTTSKYEADFASNRFERKKRVGRYCSTQQGQMQDVAGTDTRDATAAAQYIRESLLWHVKSL